jgi:hypothetical protein
VDIVVGGDHGQGKFRAVIKIILRYVDVEVKTKMIVIKAGHIEAKKDACEILKNTVTPEMNDAIKRIKQGGNVLRIFENAETGEIELTFSNDVLLNEASGCKWAMPVRAFLSGDLAFFATVLGKVNSSGSWCIWCDLARKSWEAAVHTSGDLWTIQKLKDILTGLLDKSLEDSAACRKGVTKEPLFNSIELTHYVLSVLYIEIGVCNQLLKIILGWIDMRIENIREEELDAREEYYKALLEYVAHDDRWKAWKSLKGPELATLRLERKTLNDWAGARQENSREFILSVADRTDIKIQSKRSTATISPLVEELKDLNSARQVHGQLLQAQKKRLETHEKDRKESGLSIRALFEIILKTHGVDRAAHHGGDLTGASIGIMFN